MSWEDKDTLTPQNLNSKGGLVFNVKDSDFGAVGDGTTDDTTAVQAAIDAAEVSGGIVFVPQGTYLVSAALTITADSVTIIGAGRQSTTIKQSVAAAVVSISRQSNYWAIRDLTLDCNSQGDGIFATGTWFHETHRVHIINAPTGSAGLHLHFADTNSGNSRASVRMVSTEDCDLGIWLEGTTGTPFMTTTLLDSCQVRTSSQAYLINGTQITMLNCLAQGFTDRGVHLENQCHDFRLIGGLLEASGAAADAIGIHIEGAADRAVIMPAAVSMNQGTEYQDDNSYSDNSQANEPFVLLGAQASLLPTIERLKALASTASGAASAAFLEWGARNSTAVDNSRIKKHRWATGGDQLGQTAVLQSILKDDTVADIVTVTSGEIILEDTHVLRTNGGTTDNLAQNATETLFTPADGEVWEFIIRNGITADNTWRCVGYSWTDSGDTVVENPVTNDAQIIASGSAVQAKNLSASTTKLVWKALRRI